MNSLPHNQIHIKLHPSPIFHKYLAPKEMQIANYFWFWHCVEQVNYFAPLIQG